MPRYDIGISDVEQDPARRLDITVEGTDPRQAMDLAEDQWCKTYGEEPPSALRGISWGY